MDSEKSWKIPQEPSVVVNFLHSEENLLQEDEVGESEEEEASHRYEERQEVHLVGANRQTNWEEAGYGPDNLTETLRIS